MVREVLRAGVADELDRLRARSITRPIRGGASRDSSESGISIDDQRRREGWLLWMEYWRAALRDDELREESRGDHAGLALTADASGRRRRACCASSRSQASSEETAASIVALVDGMSLQVLVGDRRMTSAACDPRRDPFGPTHPWHGLTR